MIEGSAIFLSLFTESVKTDPICLMQLGLLLVLDKPLFLLVEKGTVVPQNLKLIATMLLTFDPKKPGSYQKAAARIVEVAKAKGLIGGEK